MSTTHPPARAWRHGLPRKLMWSAAGLLLLAPAVAMRFTGEVRWTAEDFVFMGLLLAAAGAVVELGMHLSTDAFHRAGVAVAAAGGLLLLWANAAVGLVGDEADAINLLYPGVVAIAVAGAWRARLRAAGMARAMAAASAAHLGIGAFALAAGRGDGALEVAAVTAVFALPWLLAWALFRVAARRAPEAASKA